MAFALSVLFYVLLAVVPLGTGVVIYHGLSGGYELVPFLSRVFLLIVLRHILLLVTAARVKIIKEKMIEDLRTELRNANKR